MNEIIKSIEQLFFSYKNINALSVIKLPQSGGDRNYFRINYTEENCNTSVIATYSLNIKENKFFIYCTEHFSKKRLSVPAIYAINGDSKIYIQEALGDNSLLVVF